MVKNHFLMVLKPLFDGIDHFLMVLKLQMNKFVVLIKNHAIIYLWFLKDWGHEQARKDDRKD